MKKLIFVILLSAPSINAYAENKYDTAYNQCVKKAGTMNNGVMAACSEAVSEVAKKDLNTHYKKIETKLNAYPNKAELLTKLETSQKAWIQYRNAHCALGEFISVHEPYCLMLVNAQRAEELKELAE